jgi:hypothetical protein
MHDIDRTQMEFGGELESFEFHGETSEAGVFNEQQETELAAELLEVMGNEQEMDRFLGDLISRAGRAAGAFISSPTGQALGGLLKSAARKALPIAGQAIGGYFGGPTGAQIGGQLGSAAGGLFELEQEDRELDGAKSFVRMTADAVKNVAAAPQGANPRAAASAALAQAAKIHIPGLLAQGPSAANGVAAGGAAAAGAGASVGRSRTGRWIRRGNKIVLLGV